MSGPRLSTADLCDEFLDVLRVPDLELHRFGGLDSGSGRAVLVDLDADNRILLEVLNGPGEGKALLVQARSPARPAVVGAGLAELAVRNRWGCIVVDGAVRDVEQLRTAPICLYARQRRPFRLRGGPAGRVCDQLDLGGVPVRSGDLLVVDDDGVVVGDAGIVAAARTVEAIR